MVERLPNLKRIQLLGMLLFQCSQSFKVPE